MSYADTMLPQFDHEMASTRKVLERVPEDKLDWQPHPRSHTIGWNACHLAELPWLGFSILTQPQFNTRPPGGPAYQTPTLRTRAEILELFDRNVAALRKAIAELRDDQLDETWTLLSGERVFVTLKRGTGVQSFVINHMIHHRAVLCVYLRLNDIPVPGLYGPSGDEPAK